MADTTHVPGLFYRYNGPLGGHIRLFRKPSGGLIVYHWNQTPGWAKIRAWHLLGLVTLVRIDDANGALKSSSRAGWQLRLARIQCRRVYRGFSISFLAADKGYSA